MADWRGKFAGFENEPLTGERPSAASAGYVSQVIEVVIHKIGKQKVTKYAGFGMYEQIPSPLCVGAKAVYAGKSYYVHRNWAKVTCKHCLARK